ncbi:zinc knuckle [Paramuricea clavata]|uniref:Zinc knuckle, partial n=1 Tax=Paramuricea clavata TaxID=317549 RepID=A0A6S7JMD0_PARCT|nr:zinc knuckle [Paramuricea clavata]
MAVEPEQAEAPNVETNKLSLSLFRRPDKFKIGEDFDLFIKKCNLYFEAVELEDVKKRRFALLFNLSEDAFRLAEPVEFGEGENAYKDWIGKLKSLFERNQTATEKRYNFHRREQEPGESVDSYAVSLREAGARCGFHGDEYSSRQCPTMNNFRQNNTARPQTKLCYSCQKPGHLAKSCLLANQQPVNTKLQGYDKNWQMDRHVTICYRCGNSGHIAKFCNAKLEGGMGSSRDGESPKKNDSKIRLSTVSSASKKKTLMVETTINGKNKLCIVDTGASISLVSKDQWQPLKLDDTPLFPSDIVAEAANNSPIGILGKTTLNVQFDENNKSSHDFYVANEMVSEIILGLEL